MIVISNSLTFNFVSTFIFSTTQVIHMDRPPPPAYHFRFHELASCYDLHTRIL